MTKTTVPLFMMIGLAFMLAAPARADFQAGLDAYERGDYHTAMKEWRPLANQGDASAQYHLGVLYERAQGIPRDYQEALRLHRLAAEQGVAAAQYNLGNKYRQGQGVPQDYKEAVRWYRRAAEQGDGEAQNNLAVLYAQGKGVPKDFVLAHMWMNLAAAQGDKKAVKGRDFLEKEMTPAQIAEARRLAREWTEAFGKR